MKITSVIVLGLCFCIYHAAAQYNTNDLKRIPEGVADNLASLALQNGIKGFGVDSGIGGFGVTGLDKRFSGVGAFGNGLGSLGSGFRNQGLLGTIGVGPNSGGLGQISDLGSFSGVSAGGFTGLGASDYSGGLQTSGFNVGPVGIGFGSGFGGPGLSNAGFGAGFGGVGFGASRFGTGLGSAGFGGLGLDAGFGGSSLGAGYSGSGLRAGFGGSGLGTGFGSGGFTNAEILGAGTGNFGLNNGGLKQNRLTGFGFGGNLFDKTNLGVSTLGSVGLVGTGLHETKLSTGELNGPHVLGAGLNNRFEGTSLGGVGFSGSQIGNGDFLGGVSTLSGSIKGKLSNHELAEEGFKASGLKNAGLVDAFKFEDEKSSLSGLHTGGLRLGNTGKFESVYLGDVGSTDLAGINHQKIKNGLKDSGQIGTEYSSISGIFDTFRKDQILKNGHPTHKEPLAPQEEDFAISNKQISGHQNFNMGLAYSFK